MNNPIEERILKLLDRFSYGLTIEDVSERLGISRPTASKYLYGLEKEGKVSVRTIGKYRLHYPKGALKGRAFAGVHVLIALFISSLLFPYISNAALITVCSSGCDYTTVQGAINNAVAYDVVRITDSLEYNESAVINVTGTTLTSNATTRPTVFSDKTQPPINITSDNVTVNNLTIVYNGTSTGFGAVTALNVLNATIANNAVNNTGSGNDGWGVYFKATNLSRVENDIINTAGGSDNYGVFLDSNSGSNIFRSNNITTNTASSNGVRINTSGNNTFYDDSINATQAYDVFLAGTASAKNNYFVNVSFNKSDINATSADVKTKLFVQYRSDVYVVDGGGGQLSSASVFGNDSSAPNDENPSSNFSVLTNSSGQIATQILTEFLANGTYQPLVSGYLYFTNYTVNASLEGYRNAGTAVNVSESLNITLILTKIGTLVVELIDPPSPTNAAQNKTFFVNATITCRNGSCGNVQSFLRYNSSGNYPNDEISTTIGATPFWLNTTNPLSCNTNPIDQDEFCNITWYANATGAIESVWSLGSNFSSGDSYVSPNHTTNSTVTIIPCFVFLDTFSSIDFGSLYPRTQNNSAPGNSGMLYNISTNGNLTCNTNLYIKGQDLEQSGGSQKIGIGNLTWNTTNPISQQVTYDYRLLSSNVLPALNVTTYYWLTVPGGVSSSTYNGNITILANWSG